MKKRVICMSIFLVLLAICLVLQHVVINKAYENYPNAICFRSDTNINVSFSDLDNDQISLISIKTAVMTKQDSEEYQKVEIYYTDDNLYKRVPLRLLSGNFFTVSKNIENNKVVVISDKLAVEYFFSVDAVGAILIINDEEYTVCGVYKTDGSILGELSDNDAETVYMPYASNKNYKTMPCNILLLDPDAVPFSNAASDTIYKLTRKILWTTKYTSYNDLLDTYIFLQKLFWLLAGISVIAVLLWNAWKQGKKAYHLREVSIKERCIKWGVVAGLIIISGIILALVSFEPTLPSGILPSENLFDLSYYFNEWKENLQDFHSKSVFDGWRSYAFTTGGVIVLLELIAFLLYGFLFYYAMKIVKDIKNILFYRD